VEGAIRKGSRRMMTLTGDDYQNHQKNKETIEVVVGVVVVVVVLIEGDFNSTVPIRLCRGA